MKNGEGRRMRKRRVASPLSRRVRRVARPHTGLWRLRYARYPGSRLRSGNPAAQVAVRLVLLGSPPDTVHGAALRGTDPSSLLTWVRRHNAVPGAGIHPCCSGLQVQGTAISPTSAAMPDADWHPADFGSYDTTFPRKMQEFQGKNLCTLRKKGLYIFGTSGILLCCPEHSGL